MDITDNFMFVKVFSNVDVAKDFLQDVLKISIEKITVVTEATTQEDPFHKSVRFDVLAREEIPSADGKANAGRQFDIEMQVENTRELPKRARYYQGMCDLDALAKGGDPEILLNDLCYKNFYIFNKYANIKDEVTREYMQYFATKKCESKKMERIHELVEKYRKDPIARKAYMTLEQELNIREKKGAEAKNKELAKGFRDDGIPLEIISKRTGLSPEEIKAL